MKALHRTKTLAAYEGARLVLKNDMAYPAYMLLKEAARGVLSYMVEDSFEQDISEKTKLSRLLDFVNIETLTTEDVNNINKLITAENAGLDTILSMSVEELKEIKHTIKGLIAKYMKEPI